MKKIYFSAIGLLILPQFVFAQATTFSTLKDLINNITNNVIGALGTLFLALGVVAFFFGMVQFIFASRDGDNIKMKNGKQFMLWSVISLFVMFSIYGIIRFAQTNLALPSSDTINIPSLRINGGNGNNNNNNNNNNDCDSASDDGDFCTTLTGATGRCDGRVCVTDTGDNRSAEEQCEDNGNTWTEPNGPCQF